MPFQGAESHSAVITQGVAIGLIIYQAFSLKKKRPEPTVSEAKGQHNINPMATPWVNEKQMDNALNQRSAKLKGNITLAQWQRLGNIINPMATPWVKEKQINNALFSSC